MQSVLEQLILPRRMHRALVVAARRAGASEVCGALLGYRNGAIARAERIVELPNRSPQPERAFEIPPEALVECYRQSRAIGSEWIGFFHSHPNGVLAPSREDLDGGWEGYVQVLVGGDTVTAWVFGRREAHPLDVAIVGGEVAA